MSVSHKFTCRPDCGVISQLIVDVGESHGQYQGCVGGPGWHKRQTEKVTKAIQKAIVLDDFDFSSCF